MISLNGCTSVKLLKAKGKVTFAFCFFFLNHPLKRMHLPRDSHFRLGYQVYGKRTPIPRLSGRLFDIQTCHLIVPE